MRERTLDAPSRSTKSATESEAVTIDRVKIVEGAIVASNARDRVERRIEGINADATIGADHKLKLAGTARTDSTPLKFGVEAALPAQQTARQVVPVEFALDAPGLLRAPLAAKAEVRFNGPLIMINSLAGTIGDGAFNGWASVDVASKPLVKLDLDFQKLELAVCANRRLRAAGARLERRADRPDHPELCRRTGADIGSAARHRRGAIHACRR